MTLTFLPEPEPAPITTPTQLLAQRLQLLERWDSLSMPETPFRPGDLVAFKDGLGTLPGEFDDRALQFERPLNWEDWADVMLVETAISAHCVGSGIPDCVLNYISHDGATVLQALAVARRLRPLTIDERRDVTRAFGVDGLPSGEN